MRLPSSIAVGVGAAAAVGRLAARACASGSLARPSDRRQPARTIVWLLAALLMPASASAQIDPTGSIRGVIRDQRGAVLPGAIVAVSAADAPFGREVSSDALGIYRLTDLLPGAYRVTIKAAGFATMVRDEVRVRAGLNLGLDVTLTVGVGETITVPGDSPMLEIRAPVTALNFSGELQRALPLTPRPQWFDFLRATPSSSLSENIYGTSFWVNGADSTSLVVQVDGADVGANVQSTTAFLKASAQIVQDVQIKTTGAEAPTPPGQGAVINFITRSGTDRFSGDAGIGFQPRKWSSNNNTTGTSASYGLVQPDVSAGGPIIRQRAWFFGAYRYHDVTTGVDRPANQFEVIRVVRPNLQPFDNELTGHQTFAKATVRALDTGRVEFTHFYGADHIYAGGPLDSEPFAYTRIGGHTITATAHALWRGKTALRGYVTFNNQTNAVKLVSLSVPSRPLHLSAARVGDTLVGNGVVATLDNLPDAIQADSPAAKLTFAFDVTRNVRLLGEHELQAGTYLQPTRLVEYRERYPADRFAVEELVFRDVGNLSLGVVPFHRRIMDREELTSTSTNSQDYAVYVQDAWRARPNLTITAGLRVDAIRRRDRVFDAIVQRTVAVSPRVGALYAWHEGRRTLRASWSRVADAVSSGTLNTLGTNSPGWTDFYDIDLDGTFETERFTPGVTTRTSNRMIDLDGLRQPFADETVVGFSQQWPGQVTTDVSVANRRYRDRAATIDWNGLYENGRFVGYRDEQFNEIYQVTGNTYNTPVYTAIDLHATKRTSRMQFVAGYTRQWRHLAGDWQPNDPASFIQPDAFANDRGLGPLFRSTTSSLSGVDLTQGSQWRDHAARAMVSVRLPGAWNLAGGYWGQSGPWSGPVVTRIPASDPAFGPPSITLGNGRVVANPLATTIRFAFPTRGEGQLRLKSVHVWNMKIGRDVVWRGVTARPSVEVLNVINRRSFYDYLRGANQLYNPNVGRGVTPQMPRAVQASLSVTF